jgi:site-specific DNA recombinase
MKVAGYGRVSTAGQVDGTSPEEQKRIITEECERKGWELYKFYSDDGISGKNTNRPSFTQMIADAKHGKFQTLMLTKLDRFARSLIDLLNSLQVLNELGVKIYCVEQPAINSEGPMGNLTLQILGAFAEFERMLILERTNSGKRSRAKQGRPSTGNLPYARTFNKETGKWSVIPELKAKVESMANDYLYNNLSFQQLAEKYHMAKSHICKTLTKRSGDQWQQHFENETVTTQMPRLLSDDVIAAIKKKSEAKRFYDHGAHKHEYLLSRFIYDAETGNALTGTPSRGSVLYYRTWKKLEKPYIIKAELIEDAIMNAVAEGLSDNNVLANYVFGGDEKNLEKDLCTRRTHLQKEYSTVQNKLSRFGDVIGDYVGDDVKSFLATLKPKIVTAEQRLKELENEIQSVDSQLQSLPSKKDIQTAREIMRKQLEASMDYSAFQTGSTFRSLPFSDKRALLKLLFAGKDASNKKYGVYVRLISANPRKFLFTAYGRLGNVQGLVTKDAYDSDTVKTIKDDKIIEGVADIIKVVDITNESTFSQLAHRARRRSPVPLGRMKGATQVPGIP